VKPDLVGSLIALAVALAIGVVASVLGSRRPEEAVVKPAQPEWNKHKERRQ